jgi:hypothetical protein
MLFFTSLYNWLVFAIIVVILFTLSGLVCIFISEILEKPLSSFFYIFTCILHSCLFEYVSSLRWVITRVILARCKATHHYKSQAELYKTTQSHTLNTLRRLVCWLCIILQTLKTTLIQKPGCPLCQQNIDIQKYTN